MSEKLVWSNTMTQDYLSSLPEESLRAELVDYGYEADMLDELDYDGLKQLVADDDYMWQQDYDDFDETIRPEIEKQSYNGIILMSGTAGRWDGDKSAGLACMAEDLTQGEFCQDCDYIAIYNDGGNLVWEGAHHDGTHHMGLYTLSDGEGLKNFVINCMGDAIDDQIDNYDIGEEEAIEDVINDLDIDYINNYCDFSKVAEVCKPIKAFGEYTEDLSKDEIDAITQNIKDAESDYIHSTAAERKAGPGYNSTVSKHGGYGYDEDLDEAKSKNPENLAMELQSIKDDYEDFGPDGFYAVPFNRFEKQYPEFTKSCIMTYLKELEILEPEELNDPELFEEYWQSGELIIPDDWPILIEGAERLSGDRAEKGYTWITLLKKHQRPFDEVDKNESLCEADETVAITAEIRDLGEYETYLQSSDLQDYGFYQGDVILDNNYDEELVNKIISAGLGEGDKVTLKLEKSEDDLDSYKVVDIAVNTNESLQEGLIDELLEDEVVDEITFPTQDNVLIINEPEVEAVPVAVPETNCVVETATNVMAAYQNANKWLDIIKEVLYTNLGCVFFSSYIHNLAHTMPVRFDKFGDILHTINMRIPYPETPYIPQEPVDIDSAFAGVFMVLDAIKISLNEFIKCTDEQQHGMACAAEALLNDIEGEYPAIYKMQQEWVNCNGDIATFDKYVGQFVEHKDELA